ncbi:MAG: hypothetical protein L5655_01885 [Thermosediminibacteraceae bacterium]|nr:hypothetical protein [Thermosediminibacteraceae bacterium]
MAEAGKIKRDKGECSFCAKIKKVSWIGNEGEKFADSLTATKVRKIENLHQKERDVKVKSSWYSEENIQSSLVAYLVSQGYIIRRVANTFSREHGKDIVAETPEGRQLWVSVKGFPENKSHPQARHYFAQAVFDAVLYRDENPSVEIALALPDGFPTYKNLASRISWLRRTLPLKIYWIDNLGNVREEGLTS